MKIKPQGLQLYSSAALKGRNVNILNLYAARNTGEQMVATEDIYVDADGNIVKEGDEKIALKIASKDAVVPQEVIDQYKLDKKVTEEPEEEAPSASSVKTNGNSDDDAEKDSSAKSSKSKKPSENKGA